MKKLYYIITDKGSFGGFSTQKEAEKTAKEFLTEQTNWHIKAVKADQCPLCGKIDDIKTIQEFGFCLWCEEHMYQ